MPDGIVQRSGLGFDAAVHTFQKYPDSIPAAEDFEPGLFPRRSSRFDGFHEWFVPGNLMPGFFRRAPVRNQRFVCVGQRDFRNRIPGTRNGTAASQHCHEKYESSHDDGFR